MPFRPGRPGPSTPHSSPPTFPTIMPVGLDTHGLSFMQEGSAALVLAPVSWRNRCEVFLWHLWGTGSVPGRSGYCSSCIVGRSSDVAGRRVEVGVCVRRPDGRPEWFEPSEASLVPNLVFAWDSRPEELGLTLLSIYTAWDEYRRYRGCLLVGIAWPVMFIHCRHRSRLLLLRINIKRNGKKRWLIGGSTAAASAVAGGRWSFCGWKARGKGGK